MCKSAGVSLSQVVAMNQDKAMAAKWLAENVDDVLHDLNRVHNMDMANATMFSLLGGDRPPSLKLALIQNVLLENAT